MDDDLQRIDLLDCSGHVSHTLTLLVDGSVRIEFADGRTARVDPTAKCNLTPHVPVPRALMDRAAQLTAW